MSLPTILSRSSRPKSSSLKKASKRLVDGPLCVEFNNKSIEWVEAHLDRRGILVDEIIARNELIVLNRCRDFTFRRRAGGGGVLSTSRLPYPVLPQG